MRRSSRATLEKIDPIKILSLLSKSIVKNEQGFYSMIKNLYKYLYRNFILWSIHVIRLHRKPINILTSHACNIPILIYNSRKQWAMLERKEIKNWVVFILLKHSLIRREKIVSYVSLCIHYTKKKGVGGGWLRILQRRTYTCATDQQFSSYEE